MLEEEEVRKGARVPSPSTLVLTERRDFVGRGGVIMNGARAAAAAAERERERERERCLSPPICILRLFV